MYIHTIRPCIRASGEYVVQFFKILHVLVVVGAKSIQGVGRRARNESRSRASCSQDVFTACVVKLLFSWLGPPMRGGTGRKM